MAALQQRLKTTLADPLAHALDEIVRSGDEEARLVALQEVIEEFQARLRLAQDIADTPSEDQILSILATLTELAADEDVVTMVEWAAEHAERVSRLRQEIEELKQRMRQEINHWGWNGAIHGDCWVIRPDERAE